MHKRPHSDLRGRAHSEPASCETIATPRGCSEFKSAAAHCGDLSPAEQERRKRQSERVEKIYLDTRRAAKHVGLSESFLHKARHFGDGPPFFRVGRAIRYSTDDLDRWMAEHRVAEKRGH